MKVRKQRKFLGILLAVVLTFSSAGNVAIAAPGEVQQEVDKEAKESAAIVSHENRESGMVGFSGTYAVSESNTPISVIVEFVHQPAKLTEAIAEVNGEDLKESTKELKKLAQKDREDFYQTLEKWGKDYTVKYEYTEGMNGVAITVPESQVDDIADLDCVFAVYPDEVLENVLEPEQIYEESEVAPGEDDTLPVNPVSVSADEADSEEIAAFAETAERPEEEVAEPEEELSEEEVAAPEEELSEEEVAAPEENTLTEEPETEEGTKASRSTYTAKKAGQNDYVKGMDESRKYLGIDALNQAGLDGAGVTVGVIDTGIDWTHPDLQNVFSDKLPNGKTPSGDELLNGKFIGRNYIDNGNAANNPMDDQGHGSHVSGTIAGRGELTGDRNITVLGVAPKATLAAYKVINAADSCSVANVNKAMEDAVADGCKIISMSLGWSRVNDTTHATTVMLNGLALANEDVLFVVCAGNSGPNSYTIWSPGTSPMALTVANARIDSADRLLTLSRDGSETTSKFRLIRSGWQDAVVKDTENGIYTISSLSANEDGKYRMVLLPTVDGTKLGTGTREEFDAFLKDKDPADYAGALFVVNRGQSFDTVVWNIKQTVGVGAEVVLNTQSRENDFESISWWQGCMNNYLPVFTMRYAEGAELVEGLTLGESYDFQFTAAEGLHSTAYGDNGAYPANDTSIGPAKNTFDLKPDLAAPGTAILSSYWSGKTENEEDRYTAMNGTSMATPHVSGIAALLRQRYPEMTALQLKSILVHTADADAFSDNISRLAVGAGMVNPAAALAACADKVSMTAPNAQGYTSSESGLVSNSVPTPTISLGVVNGNGEKSITVTVTNDGNTAHTYAVSLENEKYTGVNSSRDAKASSGVFSVDTQSITVPAGSTATFELKAKLPTGASIGAYETTVVLTEGNKTLKSPAAVYMYEIPKIDPIMDDAVIQDYTFLQSAVVSAGEDRQLADESWGDWTYFSDRTMLHFSFKDWTIESWQPLLYDKDGNLMGVTDQAYTDTWYAEGDGWWHWYYSNVIGTWYAPCEIDENGNVSWGDYETIPEGAYTVALMLKKEGADAKIVKFADLYVDNTLPELQLTNGNDTNWKGTIDGDNVIFKGNIYDEGTAEMQELGINSSVDEKVFGNQTSQKDNIVVMRIGENDYRAEVDENGDFQIIVPREEADQTAVVYYGDHFLPQGSEGRPDTFGDGFQPDMLSYAVNKDARDVVPWMNWYAYHAANMTNFEVELKAEEASNPEDVSELKAAIQAKIDELKAEAEKTDVYTAESIKEVKAIIDAAEALLKDENATKEQLEEQLAALNAAKLVKKDTTEKPDKPGKPENPTKPGESTGVKTGDESPIMFYVVLLGISACLVGFVTYTRRKRTVK